jgi:Ca2+-binding EF-hand superfamily protein
LKKIFDDIDENRDGSLASDELEKALILGQPDLKFDKSTVDILLKKFDGNNDSRITVEEFYSLFSYLNQEYEKFLMIDIDQSGTINSNEFISGLKDRCSNIKLNDDFYDRLKRKMDSLQLNRLTFDKYCRWVTQVNYFSCLYSKSPDKSKNIEDFIKKYFLDDVQNFLD